MQPEGTRAVQKKQAKNETAGKWFRASENRRRDYFSVRDK